MAYKTISFGALLLLGSLLSGCVALQKHPGFDDVGNAVKERTNLDLKKLDDSLEKELPGMIESSLRDELTIDQAIQIALVNNQLLQATFQELGIAKADLLQAGLLKNPNFHMFTRFPKDGGNTNVEFSITQDILDLFYLPLRRRVAAAQFEQTKLRVADAVISLVAETKSAYYMLQAAEQIKATQKTVLEAAEAAVELSERQFKAGNLKELDYANQKATYEQAYLDYLQSETLVLTEHEPLIRLLGLSGKEEIKISSELPKLPSQESEVDLLIEKALAQRLDLASVRKEIEVFRRTLLATRFGIIQNSEFGINSERDANGERVTGPEWGFDVPIFNWRQAEMARAKAQIRQGQFTAGQFEIKVRSEVRAAYKQMMAARTFSELYRDKIIPTREQIISLTQQQYNFMLQGVYQLLQAKQNEVTAKREYISSLKDYWIARTDLERAVGGSLSVTTEESSKNVQSQSQMAHQHHGGKVQ